MFVMPNKTKSCKILKVLPKFDAVCDLVGQQSIIEY